MLSVHTSPLHQPGTGDAGGMNVYMLQLARRLAEQGADVDLFTRCGAAAEPLDVDLAPGVRVRHLVAGPRAPLAKEQLPHRLPEFSLALLRAAESGAGAGARPYDVVHSHYWLSGQAGRIAAAHWRIPLVHTMHTLARVKNAALAEGDTPEPESRVQGEHRVVGAADRLIANTPAEAEALRSLYGAAAPRTRVVRPGVDLRTFRAGDGRDAARARLGIPRHAFVPLFAGRIQPLKGPDVLLRAVVELLGLAPDLRRRLLVPVIGGLSGTGTAQPERWHKMCARLGIADVVRFQDPVPQHVLADWYRAADVVVVPSRSESFGLVALEAQACGTPVLAAAVGGLPTAVRDGVSGMLVEGHDPRDYARGLLRLARRPELTRRMGRAAEGHAAGLSWERAAAETLEVYRSAAGS
ncbi:D-inositol-3-phosphate glycosyltransferase [Streptomyces sp. HNM0574]|uniref:D-inositol-3-phosphate glycosyltransferase n=1 Tax=Streptomyces sp. HNM0574 TaxID=2714954 RepID=UPI00146B6AA4|nr:D-inositol-3-phosphate glycosyltransferase [Streptomyces sp. HNM0574]NLU66125.1 D-inositol-3-phosphate glycosyltransferase [Streptomyces sp. HNM0574]